MGIHTAHAPVLVFAYGNPSRGDDALGPAMFDLLEQYKQESTKLDGVDLLTDYQLQIEHAIDLEQRECVLFIDASVACSPPYELLKLQASRDDSYTTHAMSPAALLSVYEQINNQGTPAAYMLSIRGYTFDLGLDLSTQARVNLQQGYRLVRQLLENNNVENWAKMHII